MSDRITRKQLEALADLLNIATNSPPQPWTPTAEGPRANIGNFYVSGAYGGFCLHRIVNDGGGVTTPLSMGHIPARRLYEQMHAYLSGIEFGKTL
jgi:hypothetical protein